MAGTLFLISTPIGNLEDLTPRAIKTLEAVDLIAVEDTRRTRKLLAHFKIKGKKMIPYHDHNAARQIPKLIAQLKKGESIALASDAGTPLINDPGFKLVKEAIQNGVKVVPIPGASAILTALIASGLPPYPFTFLGYLPRKREKRRQFLQNLKEETTFIAFESPHRLIESLKDIASALGKDVQIVVGREMTKIHEEFLRGTVHEVLGQLQSEEKIKGEVTLVWR